MDKQTVLQPHNWIPLSNEKEGNTVTQNNLDKS